MVQRHAQTAVIVIVQRDEAEWLKHPSVRLAGCTQKLSHAVHWSGLRLESDLDEIALAQRGRHLQKPSGGRDGLEFSFCATAVFQTNCSQD